MLDLDIDTFHFRQFSVRHHQSSFKVGFDGVLLGAWCKVENSKSILDVGTGTGLLALMAAQKSGNAKIVGIEPDHDSFQEAEYNFRNSPWAERLIAINTTLQHFATNTGIVFDHIISNPPYFSNSLMPKSKPKLIAKHTFNLSHHDLLKHSSSILADKGKLSVIIPYPDKSSFIENVSHLNLYASRITDVFTTKPERVLIEFTKNEIVETQQYTMKVYNNNGNYSEEYLAMVREFYLKI